MGGTRIEVPKARESRRRGGGGIRTGVPLPNQLRAGADPGVEIEGHLGEYFECRARAYNGDLGLCP